MTHGLEGRCSIQLSYGRTCQTPNRVGNMLLLKLFDDAEFGFVTL